MKEPKKLGGYAGQILHVDLTKGKCKPTPLDKAFALTFIGGQGFVSKWLFDLTGPKTDPLGPENILIWATGAFTGTLWPQDG